MSFIEVLTYQSAVDSKSMSQKGKVIATGMKLIDFFASEGRRRAITLEPGKGIPQTSETTDGAKKLIFFLKY